MNKKTINLGYQLVSSKRWITDIPHGDTFDLAQVYTQLSRQGALAGFEVSERFYEIGSLQGLQETERFLIGKAKQINKAH